MGSKYLCVVGIVSRKTETYLKVNEGGVENSKTIAVSPGESNKGKSRNSDEDGHGQKKRKPTTLR